MNGAASGGMTVPVLGYLKCGTIFLFVLVHFDG
jgi:hypothetical protein